MGRAFDRRKRRRLSAWADRRYRATQPLMLQALERRLACAADAASAVVDQWSSSSFYGSLGEMLGDVNGDGRADAIAWNSDSKWVALAKVDGTGFAEPALWQSKPFYGSLANEVGDVDGDGRVDLIAWNATSVWVSPALAGGGFGDPVSRHSGAFYGDVCQKVADVNGDGRIDLLAWNQGAKWVALANSAGDGFGEARPWGESNDPFFGSVTNAVGDVNGDRFADLVAWNRDSVFVMAGSSQGFAGPRAWLSSPFYGTRGSSGSVAADTQFVADVNGDGRSDLVAWNDVSKWVALSNGSSFAAAGEFQEVPFYGGRRNLVGDVDGDGRQDLVSLNEKSIYTARAVTHVSTLAIDRGAADHGVLRGTLSDGSAVTYFGSVGADGLVSGIDSAVVRDFSGQSKTLRFGADGRLNAVEFAGGDTVGLTWDSATSITWRIHRADGSADLVVAVPRGSTPQAMRSLAAAAVGRSGGETVSAMPEADPCAAVHDLAEVLSAICSVNSGLTPTDWMNAAALLDVAATASGNPEFIPLIHALLGDAKLGLDLFCKTAGGQQLPAGSPAPVNLVEDFCRWLLAHSPIPFPQSIDLRGTYTGAFAGTGFVYPGELISTLVSGTLTVVITDQIESAPGRGTLVGTMTATGPTAVIQGAFTNGHYDTASGDIAFGVGPMGEQNATAGLFFGKFDPNRPPGSAVIATGKFSGGIHIDWRSDGDGLPPIFHTGWGIADPAGATATLSK